MHAQLPRPLDGKRILITRPKEQAEALSRKLRALGAATIELPTIAILPPDDWMPFDKHLRRMDSYDWIVFTSVHGVRFFLKRMADLGIPDAQLRNRKVAAVGPATAEALQDAGKKPDYMPKEFLTEQIAVGLGDIRGKWILLPRADIASKKLPDVLRARHAIVEETVAYRTVAPDDLTAEKVKEMFRGIDLVTFTSPSTVTNVAKIVGEKELPAVVGSCRVACIGPITLQTARMFGLNVHAVASTYTSEALVEAIVNEIGTI